MVTKRIKKLETFENPYPQRNYNIRIDTSEFTCLCPKTGQPDYATIYIDYVPDKLCVELKSLKQYLWSFRDQGTFHEAVTNKIMDDLITACNPREITITAEFNIRGGIQTTVTVCHTQSNCSPTRNSEDV